jgi:hypothetical protein
MTQDKFLKLLQDRDAAIECLRQLEDDVDPQSDYVFMQGRQEWFCMQELLELAKFAAGVSPGYVPGVTHGESPSGRIDTGRPNIQNIVAQTGAGKAMQAAIFPTDLQLKAKDGQ